MLMNRKVVIIGDGAVGSTLAYTLLLQDSVNDIVIVDLNKKKAEGDVLDMIHGMSFLNPKKIKAGDYSDIKDAHIIVITAGVAQKEGESRIDLLNRNLKVFDSIIASMKPYLSDSAIVMVVTNPVDILSYYVYKKLGIPSNRVIGSGTVLDTSRLKSFISEDTGIYFSYVNEVAVDAAPIDPPDPAGKGEVESYLNSTIEAVRYGDSLKLLLLSSMIRIVFSRYQLT